MSYTQTSRLKYLLDQFAVNALTEREFAELFKLIGQDENEEEVKAVLAADLDAQMPGSYDRTYWAEKFRSLNLNPSLKKDIEDTKVRRLFPWRRVAVAASILLVIGLGSYFMFFNKTAKLNEVVKNNLPKDVEAPKGTKAMITLADGKKVLLDSVISGTLAIQDNVNVLKTNDG